MVRRGMFETNDENDSSGGQKVYRLRWDTKQQYVLTPKETLSGLFIRYLISRGKLSEFFPSSEKRVLQAED